MTLVVTDHPGSDLASLSMGDLRSARARARRALELAQLRSRQVDGGAEQIAALTERVRALSDELIRRYADDLSLVDSLLDPPYPHGVGTARPLDDASMPAHGPGGAVR